MLKDILSLKLEFGGAGKEIPIILDTPIYDIHHQFLSLLQNIIGMTCL